MTKQKLKDEIVKIIGCSVMSLDLVDIYEFLPEELNNSIQYCNELLDELIREKLIKKSNQGSATYYSINI